MSIGSDEFLRTSEEFSETSKKFAETSKALEEGIQNSKLSNEEKGFLEKMQEKAKEARKVVTLGEEINGNTWEDIKQAYYDFCTPGEFPKDAGEAFGQLLLKLMELLILLLRLLFFVLKWGLDKLSDLKFPGKKEWDALNMDDKQKLFTQVSGEAKELFSVNAPLATAVASENIAPPAEPVPLATVVASESIVPPLASESSVVVSSVSPPPVATPVIAAPVPPPAPVPPIVSPAPAVVSDPKPEETLTASRGTVRTPDNRAVKNLLEQAGELVKGLGSMFSEEGKEREEEKESRGDVITFVFKDGKDSSKKETNPASVNPALESKKTEPRGLK